MHTGEGGKPSPLPFVPPTRAGKEAHHGKVGNEPSEGVRGALDQSCGWGKISPTSPPGCGAARWPFPAPLQLQALGSGHHRSAGLGWELARAGLDAARMLVWLKQSPRQPGLAGAGRDISCWLGREALH